MFRRNNQLQEANDTAQAPRVRRVLSCAAWSHHVVNAGRHPGSNLMNGSCDFRGARHRLMQLPSHPDDETKGSVLF